MCCVFFLQKLSQCEQFPVSARCFSCYKKIFFMSGWHSFLITGYWIIMASPFATTFYSIKTGTAIFILLCSLNHSFLKKIFLFPKCLYSLLFLILPHFSFTVSLNAFYVKHFELLLDDATEKLGLPRQLISLMRNCPYIISLVITQTRYFQKSSVLPSACSKSLQNKYAYS